MTAGSVRLKNLPVAWCGRLTQFLWRQKNEIEEDVWYFADGCCGGNDVCGSARTPNRPCPRLLRRGLSWMRITQAASAVKAVSMR